jgi:hypothetical protein
MQVVFKDFLFFCVGRRLPAYKQAQAGGGGRLPPL